MRFDPELLILSILLAGLIVAGCVVVVRVRRWHGDRGWHDDELAPRRGIGDQLAIYQSLVERGELTPQEFERIKLRLEQAAARHHPEVPPEAPPPANPS